MVDLELNEDGDARLVAGVKVVRVKGFVGFGVLVFKGDPMFLLSMSFLDRHDVVVVYEVSDSSFLSIPTVLREAFGGEKAVGIPGSE